MQFTKEVIFSTALIFLGGTGYILSNDYLDDVRDSMPLSEALALPFLLNIINKTLGNHVALPAGIIGNFGICMQLKTSTDELCVFGSLLAGILALLGAECLDKELIRQDNLDDLEAGNQPLLGP